MWGAWLDEAGTGVSLLLLWLRIPTHHRELGVTGRGTVEAVGLGTQQVRAGADLPCWSQTPLRPDRHM